MSVAVKKVIGWLISPLAGGGILLLLALALSRTERFGRLGRIGLTAGLLVGFLLGTRPVAHLLILPLESRYTAVDPASVDPDVEWIVVLGGGHAPDVRMPPAALLNPESLYRLTEGVRLHSALPDSRLVVSGRGPWEVPHAEVAARVAEAMGVDRARIEVQPEPRDTREEAAHTRALLGEGTRVLLVTSAAHLPRALFHFRAQGLDPVPAPAQSYSRGGILWNLRALLPSAESYRMVERAVHEYVGFAWARLLHGRL